MEKETLLSTFTQRFGEPGANGYFGDTGISQRTLEVYVDNILPIITSDDMVNDDFYARHENILKSMGGQLRHMNGEFVKNYKPEQTQTQESASSAAQKPSSGDDVVAQLLESNRKLSEQLTSAVESINSMKQEREAEAARAKVEGLFGSAMKSLRDKISNAGGEVNEGVLGMARTVTNYADGMDEAALLASLQSNYEKQYKAVFGEGSTPLSGGDASYGGKSYIEQLKEKEKTSSEMIEKVRAELK